MSDWREVLTQLVEDRERALLGYAYLVCGNATQAQDLVQDALVRTFSKPRPGLTAVKAEGYVRRAITTVYIDGYRREQRWRRVQHLFREEQAGSDPTTGIEAGTDVTAALATLPPRERACVVLRYFDDLTVPQIAHQLGLAPGSVKRYVHDGLARLELVLGPLEDVRDPSPDGAPRPSQEGR
ncbi:sigma-70 family RNA polymerase sigma factor [Demequina sp. SYSU T00039]|uniref:Sigma-70 family RNA polymerase sigma factor n=1 Tax=Demequina lignilytica TaxID=3051663 RepID=A0AAW7M3U2_9MICO|nr:MULTISPECIES: sigma-70 family RNA polymerase sigma factor [unclassified Demequina]MDN4478596.1 sigma-70 family RNA polymerase sigma factor [Demequina sp. SYSU T00039-1]MDN4488574.1 sigma-70 family RNA polymerase sigma factor [Demequina sp. SYSU T00039]MDN4491600.1 sigma-70 family RNA polymerase sigma factor [Demequina sp. SYSU T00068]